MRLGAVLRIVAVGIAAAFAGACAAAEERPKAEIVPQLGHSGIVHSVTIAPDGKTARSGSEDNTLRLWDLASGCEIGKFEGHSGEVRSVAYSPDGKTALSGSHDGTVRLWDLKRGEALASLIASRDGAQLATTRDGFFTASQRDTDMLAIVRGLEVTSIGRVYQSLFYPDLVREALAGDPDGEAKRAAEVINLDKVSMPGRRPLLPSPRTSPAAAPAKTSSPSPPASRIAERASGASNGA